MRSTTYDPAGTVADGIAAFERAVAGGHGADSSGRYRRLSAEIRSAMRPGDTCALAFAADLDGRGGSRGCVPAFVAVLDDRVVVAWRRGRLRPRSDTVVLPRRAITGVRVPTGRSDHSRFLVTVDTDGVRRGGSRHRARRTRRYPIGTRRRPAQRAGPDGVPIGEPTVLIQMEVDVPTSWLIGNDEAAMPAAGAFDHRPERAPTLALSLFAELYEPAGALGMVAASAVIDVVDGDALDPAIDAKAGAVVLRDRELAPGVTGDAYQLIVVRRHPDIRMVSVSTFTTANLPCADRLEPGFHSIAESIRFRSTVWCES